jgi:hypothetical protein
MASVDSTKEHTRLQQHRLGKQPWKCWGPYLAERAWGTIREDYSPDGSAWSFLTHDMSRSKAYRWGEDGIAGFSDDQQLLCLNVALWNGADPILKERLFGLTGPEGNHGEDVKEVYYYLDSTPTHSYMKLLYKYPQAEFPYAKLVETNAARTSTDPEYELADTGVFNESRYFDVVVEYAKATPEEICIRVTATNRGPQTARLHIIPQMWFRNTWAWGKVRGEEPLIEYDQRYGSAKGAYHALTANHRDLGKRWIYALETPASKTEAMEIGGPTPLFTDNESNTQRLYGVQNPKAYVKDAFHEYICRDRSQCVNPLRKGTKAALHYVFDIEPGQSRRVRWVLRDQPSAKPFRDFEKTFVSRQAEAQEFYDAIHHPGLSADERAVQRQAFAGMLWSKQFYLFDVHAWQYGDNPSFPPPRGRLKGRNRGWSDLYAADIISMPDKWEYPWFAAWDLAFHVIPLAMIDVDFAKAQLELLISEKLMHPNGQIPAYEWEFSDVNPPVQAWAVWRVYNIEKHANHEEGDRAFLERCYHKLLLNFVWWVNRQDSTGRNIFQGGFLGLDNISIFDRSQPLPGGGLLEQADATGWMALFCLDMMAIGLELAQGDAVYEHLGIKFFEHFMAISAAINQEIVPGVRLWNETDNWYYDVVHGLNGRRESARQIAVRSQVGLIPLFAAAVLDHNWFDKLPNFKARYEWLLSHRPEISAGMACLWTPNGARCLLSIVNYDRLKLILQRTLDETEFLAPNGIRSLSRFHLEHPFVLSQGDKEWTVRYEPAESSTRLFGGNSNWRGPIWFPTAFMLITALRVYDRFYQDGFTIECPTGSGHLMTLNQVAMELARRMCLLFLPDAQGNRPLNDSQTLFQTDPNFRADLFFPEYFNGDTGQGLGATHQTGWTGLIAKLLDQVATDRAAGKKPAEPKPPTHA